jgi:hypothetical protein
MCYTGVYRKEEYPRKELKKEGNVKGKGNEEYVCEEGNEGWKRGIGA